jgi:hypothetical protein
MLLDLRLKVRNRRSNISSCGYREFLPLTRQFFAFVAANPILSSTVAEFLARNPKSVEEVTGHMNPSDHIYGETAEEAAVVGYTKWKGFAGQDRPDGFFGHVTGVTGSMDDALSRYRDWYVEPFFEHLDEVLEDSNVILGTLIRYKHKVEWYRRQQLQKLFADNSSQGEKTLARHMYEYLFDQGIPFQIEPQTASGRPDVTALDNSEHPFIGDVKVFDAAGRGAAYIRKGLYQVYQYCCDCNESVGHLIVFNVSEKQLRFALPSGAGGIPRFEYNHKTIFVTIIDIHEHDGTASKRGIPDTVTISKDDVISEAKEQEQPQPQGT